MMGDMMKHLARLSFALLATCLATAPAWSATYTPITLPSLNTDISGYTGGAAYSTEFPAAAGSMFVTYNGVPFRTARNASGNNAYADPFFNGDLVMSTSILGATHVYTLINSSYGISGANNGRLTFAGTGGALYSVNLIQGQNIRDHFDGGFNNVINGTSAVAGFSAGPGQARLDMQIFTLPTIFASERLTSITFTGDSSAQNLFGGVPFMVAATVLDPSTIAAVPEPEAIALWLAGLAMMAGIARRGRRNTRP